MITLDLTGRAPIYEQICSQFSSLISKGVLKENDKLPSSRMLAKELGLNPNTVAKAYSRLEHDDIIYSVAGKGCLPPSLKNWRRNRKKGVTKNDRNKRPVTYIQKRRRRS